MPLIDDLTYYSEGSIPSNAKLPISIDGKTFHVLKSEIQGITNISNGSISSVKLGIDITSAGKSLLTASDASSQRDLLGISSLLDDKVNTDDLGLLAFRDDGNFNFYGQSISSRDNLNLIHYSSEPYLQFTQSGVGAVKLIPSSSSLNGTVPSVYFDASSSYTLLGDTLTQTVTNKIISGSNNTISNIAASSISSGVISPSRLGSGSPSSSNFLRGDGSWQTLSDFIGGSSGSTDNAILRANGSGGATLQESLASISDSGAGTFIGSLIVNKSGNSESGGIEVADDVNNGAVRATYILPPGNSGRIYIGKSGHGVYALNLQYCTGFESLPAATFVNGIAVGTFTNTSISRSANGTQIAANHPSDGGLTIYHKNTFSSPVASDLVGLWHRTSGISFYGTNTSSTNYERISLSYDTANSIYYLDTQKGSGGGTARPFELRYDNRQLLRIEEVSSSQISLSSNKTNSSSAAMRFDINSGATGYPAGGTKWYSWTTDFNNGNLELMSISAIDATTRSLEFSGLIKCAGYTSNSGYGGLVTIVGSTLSFSQAGNSYTDINKIGDTLKLASDTYKVRIGNSTSAHRLEISNTYTGSTNYEYGILGWLNTTNVFSIGTEKGSGGGTARGLQIVTDSVPRIEIGSTGNVIINSNTAPATASSTGSTGEVRFDSNYIYRCISTNTWKRSPLSTW
jgi:hypothetical protein